MRYGVLLALAVGISIATYAKDSPANPVSIITPEGVKIFQPTVVPLNGGLVSVRITRPNPRVTGQVIEATSVDAVIGFLEPVFFTEDLQLVTVRSGFQFTTGNTFRVGTNVNTQVTINSPRSLTMTNVAGTIAPLSNPQPFSNSRIEVTFSNPGTVTYNLPLIGTPKTSRIIQLAGIRGNLTIPPAISLSRADKFVPNNNLGQLGADGESNDSPLSTSRILPSLTND